MPVPKDDFEEIHPADFYKPADIFEDDQMYTVAEIARLLQRLDTDAELDGETEAVLLDWAIPWIIHNAEELVVGDPLEFEGPGYYGLRTDSSG